MTSSHTPRLPVQAPEGIKSPVAAATIEEIDLEGLQVINGYQLNVNDRVLVKNQTDLSTNGIYSVQQRAWVRAKDWKVSQQVANGVLILDNNTGQLWRGLFAGVLDIGVTDVSFTNVTSSGRTITYVQETLPVEPVQDGAKWYKPSEVTTYIYFKDVDSGQWIEDSVQSAEGTLRSEMRNRAVFLSDFGVYKNSGKNETAKILEAIDYHAENDVTLYVEAGEYIFDGVSRTGKENIRIVGINGRAVFKSTAIDQRTFRFQCNNDEVTAASNSDIGVGQNSITLVDASALSIGMMIRITSNVLWPYDNRGVYYRGETHVIENIVGNEVFFTDRTRDSYTLAQIDNITAWKPAQLRLENLEVDHSDFRGTSCYQITGYMEPIFRNLKSVKAKTAGLWMLRCWHPRAYDIHSEYIGDGIETGYGAQDRSCVGLRIDGIYTVGCRRSFDAETESGSNSSPSRDYLVTNFIVRGGGDYFPETLETSYGIGNHGPSENGRFTNGKIFDCKVGVNHRGSKLELSDIEVYGKCTTVIDGTFGSGYNMDNVRYYPSEYPNTIQDMSTLTLDFLPECFVRFGRSSTTIADFNFDLPINISNCSAVGLKEAFIYSENATQKLGNLNVVGNSISLATDASLGDFSFVRHVSFFSRSNFDSNKVEAGDRDWQFCNNDVGVRDGIDDRYAVMIDGSWTFRVQDDDFIRVPNIAAYNNARPIVGLSTDALGREIFELRPNSDSKPTASSLSWAALSATATPTNINGTSGTDGEFTIGLTLKNEVYFENRSGSERAFRLALVF